MQALIHPNILKLEHFERLAKYPHKDGTHRDVAMLVLELAEGGSLLDFLLEAMSAFPEGLALAYFQQLLDGIVHLKAIKNKFLNRNIAPNTSFFLLITQASIGVTPTMFPTAISNRTIFCCPCPRFS